MAGHYGRGRCQLPFPSPSLSAPGLAAYEFSFRGLAFGGFAPSSAYHFAKMPTGIGGMTIVGGDVQRAQDQGELTGMDLAAGRDIEIELVVKTDEVSLDHARQALGGVLGSPGGVTEEPLWFQLPTGIFAAMVRPRKHAPVLDLNMVQAGGDTVLSMLHADDPRWYGAPSKTATTLLPEATGGVEFPIEFPVDFGGGETGGMLELYNNGTFEMRPILIITAGPLGCVVPTISNASIAGAPTITANITMAPGDMLELDTDFESALYTPSGATRATSRKGTTAGSTWWNMPPGLNIIDFQAAEGAGSTLTVNYADAYSAI